MSQTESAPAPARVVHFAPVPTATSCTLRAGTTGPRARPEVTALLGRETTNRGWILIALGVGALVIGGWGSAQYRDALSRGPLLRDPSGLVVDGSGRIYCGVASSRIHVYDPSGRIVRVWPVESGGGPIRLRLPVGGGSGAVEVIGKASGSVALYDREGNLVGRRDDHTAWDAIGSENDREYTTEDRVTYAYRGTAVVRESPDGVEVEVVVRPIPAPLRWFAGATWVLVMVFVAGPIAIFAGLIRSGRAKRVSHKGS